LKVSPGTVSLDTALGRQTSRDMTLKNTGGAPLHVTVGEQNSGSSTAGGGSAGAWQTIADYPGTILDNAAAFYAGKEYSVGGPGVTASFAYDPVTESWSPIASLPQALESPVAAFVNGTMYVAGGWSAAGVAQSTAYAYHPTSNTWSQIASLPGPVVNASVAVLNGELYVIGGCAVDCSDSLSAVYRYSPAENTWTTVAALPEQMSWGACAGIDNEIVCAGGTYDDAAGHVHYLASTYIYNSAKNAWAQAANMPYADGGMASSGANGQLQIVGGFTESGPAAFTTNQAEQYDPVHNVWSALPGAVYARDRSGGSGCGLFQIGGSGANGSPVPTASSQVLPGFDQCGGDQVSWLSTGRHSVTLAPGESIRVPVTADASQVDAPGAYSAELTFTTDAPYVSAPTPVKLDVTRPASWGEVSGTVTAAASGAVLPGATVQICAVRDTKNGACSHPLYTVTTDTKGGFSLWMPAGSAPVDVIAASDGYAAQTQAVIVRRGGSAVTDFALAKSAS